MHKKSKSLHMSQRMFHWHIQCMFRSLNRFQENKVNKMMNLKENSFQEDIHCKNLLLEQSKFLKGIPYMMFHLLNKFLQNMKSKKMNFSLK